jgi:alkylation response protein AidB-like acyl-CoA dehydrogenase
MQLLLNVDQRLIQESATQLYRDLGGIARLRALRDGNWSQGFSTTLWQTMGELGWHGLTVPEAAGGAGLGLAELATILEEAGKTLAPEPLTATLMAVAALAASGDSHHALLGKIADGSALATVAYQEVGTRYDVGRCGTVATVDGDGVRITGEKTHVLAGAQADVLIVSAILGDEDTPSLWCVPSDAVETTSQQRIDSHPVAIVRLDGVRVPMSARVGDVALLQRVVDAGTIGLCAEMLGGMQQALHDTLSYLNEREQFGVPIASFQALRHRAAIAYTEVELTRSTVMAAARMWDDSRIPDAQKQRAVSLAKARASDAFIQVTNEGVQMHGGVGMTDEYDIGLYMKRARVCAQMFGDAAWHRDRWATLGGY